MYQSPYCCITARCSVVSMCPLKGWLTRLSALTAIRSAHISKLNTALLPVRLSVCLCVCLRLQTRSQGRYTPTGYIIHIHWNLNWERSDPLGTILCTRRHTLSLSQTNRASLKDVLTKEPLLWQRWCWRDEKTANVTFKNHNYQKFQNKINVYYQWNVRITSIKY